MQPNRFLGLVLAITLAFLTVVSAQQNVAINVGQASWYSSPQTASVSTITLTGTGQPATTAFRVTVTASTPNVWDNGINVPTTLPANVPQGHWYLLRFSVRQVSGQSNFPAGKGISGIINIRPYNSNSYVNSLDTNFPCDSTSWCEYAIPFQAAEAHSNADPPYIMIQTSEGPQTFDVALTSLTIYGSTKPSSSLYKFYYPGRDVTTASWRTSANTRIDSIRKGDLNVKVVDSNNNVIPGATVKVVQQRHEYKFGVAIDHWLLADGTNPTYNNKISEYFNHIALANGLKQVYWEQDDGASAISALQWASARNLTCTGHVIMWGGFYDDHMPPYTWNMNAVDLKANILAHTADIVTRTRAYVDEWDVINEPVDNAGVQGTIASLGVAQTNGVLGNAFSAELFNYTYTQYNSGGFAKTPLLFVNDYNVMEGVDLLRRTYTNNFVNYIKQLSPYISGYGFQSHIGHDMIPMDVLQSRLDTLLGSDPSIIATISELDISTHDEELQADYLEDYMTFFFSQSRIRHIVQWGFWEGNGYCPLCALWRTNWSAKPAGTRYLDLVFNRWWTNTSTTTSAQGTASVRSFYGSHLLTASFNGVSKSVSVKLSSAGNNGETVIQLNTVASSASPSRSPSRAPASPSPSRLPSPSSSRAPATPSSSRLPSPSSSKAPTSPSASPSRIVSSVTTTGPHSLSVSAATPGSTITVNTRVNVGSSAIAGYLGFYIAPANDYGNELAIASDTIAINLAAGSSTPFSFTTTLAANAPLGPYWLTVAVWESNWNNIAWNTNLATLTVYPPNPTIDPISISPASVFPGQQATVTFKVNTANAALNNVYVGYSLAPRNQPLNKLVEDFASPNPSLSARTITACTFTATIPANAAPGSYDLNAGVWDSSWNSLAYSQGVNTNAVITVLDPAPYAYPVSISATTVARGGSVVINVGVSGGANGISSAFVGYSVVHASTSNVISTQNTPNVNVGAGASSTITFTAAIGSSVATGQYRVTMALWDSNWNTITWINSAYTLTVN